MKQLVEGCSLEQFIAKARTIISDLHAFREEVAVTGSEVNQRLINATVDIQCCIGLAVNQHYDSHSGQLKLGGLS